MKWLLLGPRTNENLSDDRTPEIEKLLKTSTQFISQNVKTYHQSRNHLEKGSKGIYSKIETPLNVGVGLHFYNLTRSKKLVNFLSDLNIGVNYQKVLEIKENLTKSVLQKKEQNNGVFVPTSVKKNHPIYFAIDNVDLKIDTCDGKRQLHGTGTAVYQQKREENEVSIEHNLIKISKHKLENKIVLALVCPLGTL